MSMKYVMFTCNLLIMCTFSDDGAIATVVGWPLPLNLIRYRPSYVPGGKMNGWKEEIIFRQSNSVLQQ